MSNLAQHILQIRLMKTANFHIAYILCKRQTIMACGVPCRLITIGSSTSCCDRKSVTAFASIYIIMSSNLTPAAGPGPRPGKRELCIQAAQRGSYIAPYLL